MKNLKLIAAVVAMIVTGVLAMSEACTDRLDINDAGLLPLWLGVCAWSIIYIIHQTKDENERAD